MASYASDDEQVEALKRWWKDNGNSLLAGIAIVLAVYLGVGQFQDSRNNEAGQASDLYQQLAELSLARVTQPVAEDDLLAVQPLYSELKADFSESIYTRYAALVMARFHVELDQLDQAATELQWILDNRKLGFMHEADEELFTVTRLRLARIKLAQGEPEAALTVLNAEAMQDEFIPGFAEVEGDIQLALGNQDAARAAYQKALTALNASGAGSPVLLQIKLQELGVNPAEVL